MQRTSLGIDLMMVAIVAAGCRSDRGMDAKKPVPKDEPVAKVAVPGPAAVVKVVGQSIEIQIGAMEPIAVREDTPLDELQATVLARLPASAACPRVDGIVRHLTATPGGDEPTDARVIVEGALPSSGLVGVLALLQYPARVVVNGRELPWRFCGAYDAPVAHLASTVEVINGHDVVPVSSGGIVRGAAHRFDYAVDAPALGMGIAAASGGNPIARARIFVHEGVEATMLARELDAAAAIQVPLVDLVMQRFDPEILTARLDHVKTTGGVDGSRARNALEEQSAPLATCYAQMAFVDPTLAGTATFSAAVPPGGALQPAARNVGEALARCVLQGLATITIPHVTKLGTITGEIVFGRSPDSPSGQAPSLTGSGDL